MISNAHIYENDSWSDVFDHCFLYSLDSGAIEFDEFCSALGEFMKLPNQSELESTFQTMDKNGDGYLTKDEIKTALRECGEPMTDDDVDDMLLAADANNDGKVSYKGKEGERKGSNVVVT